MSNKIPKISKKELTLILDNPYKYSYSLTISNLVELLKNLSYVYYNTKEPLVPDRVFDTIREVLEERDPTNDYLEAVGSKKENDTELPFPMASLEKIKPDSNLLDKFKLKYKGPYVLSDKLDGMSALVYKHKNDDGKIVTEMYTRGNSIFGKDISYLAKSIFKGKKLPLNTAIRGEIIISKKDFETINDKYKNVRNTVTSIRTSTHPDKDVLKIVRFVAYSIVYPEYKIEKQMEILSKTELDVVYNKTVKDITMDNLSTLLEKRRKESEYDIDGIVVIDSSSKYKISETNPKYGFAFKKVLSDQVIEADVIDVLWKASKHGYLKPRVQLNPVIIGSVTITYSTGNNAKFIVDNKIGPGAIVKLVRSGDVIPKILEVLKPASSGNAKLPSIPHKWNKTEVDFILKDIQGDQKDNVIIMQMKHFFKTLNIKYLDEGVLKLLVDSGIKDVFEIMNCKKSRFAKISGLGEKLFDKIKNEIKTKIESCELETLMAATLIFGRGIGVRKLKQVTKVYPNFLTEFSKKKVDKIVEKLNEIKGFEEKTSTLIANGIKDFNKFKLKLKEIYDISHLDIEKKKISKKKQTMTNFNVVMTGFRDEELEKFINNNGGKVSTSVSGNTTHLIYKNKDKDCTSSKFKKAQVLSVNIISVKDFKERYKYK